MINSPFVCLPFVYGKAHTLVFRACDSTPAIIPVKTFYTRHEKTL